MRTLSSAALALIPRDLRRLADIDRSPLIDTAAIAAARPLLMALGLPLGRDVYAAVVGRDTTDIGRAAMERQAAAA
jgi:hypothetical protein